MIAIHHLLVKLMLLLSTFALINPITGVYSDSSQVWLTVSSRVHKKNIFSSTYIQRELELNWNSIPITPTTWIGLFDHQPDSNSTLDPAKAIYSFTNLETSSGKHETNIQFPVFRFNQGPLTSGCLKYFVAWIEDGQVKQTNCIPSRPFWMAQHKQTIGSKPLSSLMLPGTHNSGSYSVGYETGLLNRLLNAYSLCQDEDVFNQLVYGNRYLDIRIMYDPKHGEDFWIAHDFYPIDKTVREVLLQIKQFMDSTSEEVVILDFHRFPLGFESKGQINMTRHNDLLDLVESIVGDHLTENTGASNYQKTLDSIVSTGRRLILGHAEYLRMSRPYLFPAVKQLWANTDSITQLSSYLNRTICSSSGPSAAMAELTPNAVKFLTYGGLRKLAQSVNYLVTKWFRDDWYNRCANIVATDYFLGNNIIEIAINSNTKRPS